MPFGPKEKIEQYWHVFYQLSFILSVFGDKTTAQKDQNRTSHQYNVCHVIYANGKIQRVKE